MTKRQLIRLVRRLAPGFNLDPSAVLAVGHAESGLNPRAVGDQGSSFGPWQLHQGGALPAGRGLDWASSPAGIRYALRQMSKVAGGLQGQKAVNAIVSQFERPAAPGQEIQRAMGVYGNLGGGGSAQAGGNTMAQNFEMPKPIRQAQNALQQIMQSALSGGDINAAMARLETVMSHMPQLSTLMQNAMSTAQPNRQGSMGTANNPKAGLLGGAFTMGGGPEAHESRAMGNWQSDHAWDLMTKAGTGIYAPERWTVEKVRRRDSGGTVWGWQVTLRGRNGEVFLTHLGKLGQGIRPGAQLQPGQLIGFVGDPPSFAPHLHIGLEQGNLSRYRL